MRTTEEQHPKFISETRKYLRMLMFGQMRVRIRGFPFSYMNNPKCHFLSYSPFVSAGIIPKGTHTLVCIVVLKMCELRRKPLAHTNIITSLPFWWPGRTKFIEYIQSTKGDHVLENARHSTKKKDMKVILLFNATMKTILLLSSG